MSEVQGGKVCPECQASLERKARQREAEEKEQEASCWVYLVMAALSPSRCGPRGG